MVGTVQAPAFGKSSSSDAKLISGSTGTNNHRTLSRRFASFRFRLQVSGFMPALPISSRRTCDPPGAQGQQQEAGAAGTCSARGRAQRTERAGDFRHIDAAREARQHRRRQRHRNSRMAKMPTLPRLFGLVRAARSADRDFLRRSTTSRSISFFCCSRPRAPAPITSRRWRASRGCCATPASRTSCARRGTRNRFMRFWRCRLLLLSAA